MEERGKSTGEVWGEVRVEDWCEDLGFSMVRLRSGVREWGPAGRSRPGQGGIAVVWSCRFGGRGGAVAGGNEALRLPGAAPAVPGGTVCCG